MRSVVFALGIGCAILAVSPGALAQKGKGAASSASVKPPNPENRFVTVIEFQKARRPAGANVSIEGYIVLAEPSGTKSARLNLVDATDKVLSVKDAKQTARTGVLCTASTSNKARPGWKMTARGLHRLSMYASNGKRCALVNDCPTKVRIQGSVGSNRVSLARVTRIEYQDDNGDWRELK
jgi:hypothetical protein